MKLRDLLEPAALHPSFPASKPDAAWESEIEGSKAISLKRIADALDKQNEIALAVAQGFPTGETDG